MTECAPQLHLPPTRSAPIYKANHNEENKIGAICFLVLIQPLLGTGFNTGESRGEANEAVVRSVSKVRYRRASLTSPVKSGFTIRMSKLARNII